jgi:hypothetical protein
MNNAMTLRHYTGTTLTIVYYGDIAAAYPLGGSTHEDAEDAGVDAIEAERASHRVKLAGGRTIHRDEFKRMQRRQLLGRR